MAGFVDQEESSSLDSIEWTDEKHNLYLKSMEASFVHQLYNSKHLFSSYPIGEHSSDVKLCRQGEPPPRQSKVHQHGYWQKPFYRTAPQLEGVSVDGYGIGTSLANPYNHFIATDNDAFEQQPSGFGGQMSVDGEHDQVSLNFNEEVSDQNFTDEDRENRAASGQRTKKQRTVDASAANSNDQVVPLGGSSHLPMQHRD